MNKMKMMNNLEIDDSESTKMYLEQEEWKKVFENYQKELLICKIKNEYPPDLEYYFYTNYHPPVLRKPYTMDYDSYLKDLK